MPFTGIESHDISLEDAVELTKNYRESLERQEVPTKAHYFGANDIKQLLSQPDCVGLRVYYGLEDDGSKELVIVGVQSDENDFVDGLILDKSIKCPPVCGDPNPLNGLPIAHA